MWAPFGVASFVLFEGDITAYGGGFLLEEERGKH
jgi:hypothetical protein